MPCRSDYMRPNETEIEASRVICLLDELDGLDAPNPDTFGDGYDKRVHNKVSQADLDKLKRLQNDRTDYYKAYYQKHRVRKLNQAKQRRVTRDANTSPSFIVQSMKF